MLVPVCSKTSIRLRHISHNVRKHIYLLNLWYPRSLIRVFVVRMKKLCLLGYPKCAQWRFWSDCANAQSDLNLRWALMSVRCGLRGKSCSRSIKMWVAACVRAYFIHFALVLLLLVDRPRAIIFLDVWILCLVVPKGREDVQKIRSFFGQFRCWKCWMWLRRQRLNYIEIMYWSNNRVTVARVFLYFLSFAIII